MLAAQRKREKAAAEARAKAEAEAEAEARAVAEAKAKAEAAAKAEAEAIAKAEAEARVKAEAETKAKAEAEAAAKAKAEEEERRRVEEQAAEDAALGIDSGACEICGVDDDDGLLCDGCDGIYHAKCVDLTSVPDGEWFCASCVEHGTTSAGAGVERRKSLKRKAARDERRKAAGSFFMTPHERREAAETEAKQSLKRDLEAVKQTDAALSSGKKTHHFFAMQKEKAALAKETGATAASLNPLGLYVLPAPIEQAMPPVHVSPSIDAAVVEDEAVGRNALANVVGPPRAKVGLTSAITSMTPAIKSTPMGSIASMETEETEPDDSTPMDLEEAEDAYLTDAARFVLASKGRWNARAVASGELAAARGTLRTRLAALKTRAVARCGANTTLDTKRRIRHSARRRRLGRCGRMRTDRTRLSNWYATAARRTGFATGSERGRRRSSRRTRGYPNRRAIYPRRAVRGDVRRRQATTNRATRNGTRVTTRWLAPRTRR